LINKIPPNLPFPSGSGSAPEGLMPRRETALSEPEALLSRRLGRRPKGGMIPLFGKEGRGEIF